MASIICSYSQSKPGPLLICLGGIHGNEIAGVAAIKELYNMLMLEPDVNPGFEFHGTFIGILGNNVAYQQGKRFIDEDLNRILDTNNIQSWRALNPSALNTEQREACQLDKLIEEILSKKNATECVVIDLHTTSAQGGIFAIPSDEIESIDIAQSLGIPVILGFAGGLQNTTLHYFVSSKMGIPTTSVVFESGQHDDPMAITLAIAGMVNCMRNIHCVAAMDVASRHDKILYSQTVNLPKLLKLSAHFKIQDGQKFEMLPGFTNFQKIAKGQILAKINGEPIPAPTEGRILMPLYQSKGSDGFFIVNEIEM